MNRFRKNSGIALLMAVLVSGIFFVISAAIFKIALVELLLSSSGRDSQSAFYAADTGAECGIYWQRKFTPTATDPSTSAFSTDDSLGQSNAEQLYDGAVSMIECGGAPVTDFCVSTRSGCSSVAPSSGDSYFKVDQDLNGYPLCVEVYVHNEPAVAPTVTTITSRGYNTCNTDNPRRVERAIKVTIE